MKTNPFKKEIPGTGHFCIEPFKLFLFFFYLLEVHCSQPKFGLFTFSEFKAFLDSRKFLELEQVQSSIQKPKKKKRKTCAKKTLSSLSEDSYAKFAAEIQTEFFVKVKT